MTSKLRCPRCSHGLSSAAANDVEVRACGKCGGIWLDNPASVRLFTLLDRPTLCAARDADISGKGKTVDTAAVARCPVCDAPMARTESEAASVFIDRCAEHGTWFDRNELITVARAIKEKRGLSVVFPRSATEDAPGSLGPAAGVGGDLLGGVLELVIGIFT